MKPTKPYVRFECPECGSHDILDGQDDGIAKCFECLHEWNEETGEPENKVDPIC